jgi:hypothetical protein
MSKQDDLRDVLDQAASEISQAENNPSTWLSWMIYLLARLEDKATNENPTSKEAYVEMLAALQDALRNRARTGGWN